MSDPIQAPAAPPSEAGREEDEDIRFLATCADSLNGGRLGPGRAHRLLSRLRAAEQGRAEVEEVLKQYGTHGHRCPHAHTRWRDGDSFDCTCGLAAALTRSTDPTTEGGQTNG